MNNITVSACIITYNQSEYIEKAIQGVLSQKLNHNIEIIIGDDCSTDGTTAICKKYQELYPDKIKLLKYDFNKGMMQNWLTTIKNATGKYIAICEGDDYWCDELKLQKEINLLEENQAYSLCIHNGKIYNEETKSFRDFNIPAKYILNENELNPRFIFECRGVLAPTASFVFRSQYINSSYYDFVSSFPICDFPTILFLFKEGKIGIIKEQMSVYRVSTSNGSWTARAQNYSFIVNFAEAKVKKWKEFNELTSAKYSSMIKRALSIQYSNCIDAVGRVSSKKIQIQLLYKYARNIYFKDYLFLLPRLILRRNKIL